MKSADYIVEFLVANGCEHAFVFTGGAISHVIDAFRHFEGATYVCVQNEQVGAMAAEGYARTSRKMGVAMATSGPGATNLVTGITGAYYDCIPVLFIVGQVRTYEMSGDARLLQRGFQEVDIVRMVSGVTKYAVTITRPEDIRFVLEKAWHLAHAGRPGPVLVDLPMDMQWADIDPETLRGFVPDAPPESPDFEARMAELRERFRTARRPLIVAGGGVAHADARALLRETAARLQIPVVTTYAGRDTVPVHHPTYAGVIGQFGAPAANALTGKADLVLSLGARHTIRQVGNTPAGFAPNAVKVAVNIDAGELRDGRIAADIPIHADVGRVLAALATFPSHRHTAWLDYARRLQRTLTLESEASHPADHINPYHVIATLADRASPEAIFVADTGQSLVVAAQGLVLKAAQRFFSSFAHSPMGYSVAAALGAALANPGRQVIALIGDGGLHVNLQDLQTLVFYDIPVKILLFNNHCYGLIQEYQDPNLDGRHAATDRAHGYAPPDYRKVANAFGLPHFFVENDDALDLLDGALSKPGPVICELNVDPAFRVIGLVPGVNALHDMDPAYAAPPFVSDEGGD